MDEYEVRKLTDGIKMGQSGLNVLPAVPFLCYINYLLFFLLNSCSFIARTFNERPNRLMKPSASWWS